MNLPEAGREFYDPRPSTTPTAAGWEASFDGGATWVEPETIDGFPKWLVRGPDAADHATIPTTEITEDTTPLVKATGEDDEVLIRRAPKIRLRT